MLMEQSVFCGLEGRDQDKDHRMYFLWCHKISHLSNLKLYFWFQKIELKTYHKDTVKNLTLDQNLLIKA